MTTSTKKHFLVGFEHMKAGYWGVMNARSEEEMKANWPELVVLHQRPGWMTPEDYENYEGHAYDIDGAPYGILTIILNNRARR